jgi:DNA methylase
MTSVVLSPDLVNPRLLAKETVSAAAETVLKPAPKANTATVESRWIRLGPWYAMFPLDFAYEMIQRYTKLGDRVLDPFMGRGTTLAAASALGRSGLGSEINAVAWIYASTKLQPAPKDAVLTRLEQLLNLTENIELKSVPDLPKPVPEFFNWAFHSEVLKFLLVARSKLDWRDNVIDRTLMALILVDLHGNEEKSFSNQMRQTKSMSPDYAVAWWRDKGLIPKNKDVGQMMRRKIEWRYKFGVIKGDGKTKSLLGDSTETLKDLRLHTDQKHQLLLTSPPYYEIVNYNRDQWIRRWMIGGPWSNTTRGSHKHERAFAHQEDYRQLLLDIFRLSRPLLKRNATIVVRTDARRFTLATTRSVLSEVFPEWKMQENARPFKDPTQTRLFGDSAAKPGEVDLVLTRTALAESR